MSGSDPTTPTEQTRLVGGASSNAPGLKKLFLVRHAQSEQNIAQKRLKEWQATALCTVCSLGYDASLSLAGKQQVEGAAKTLSGFVAEHKVELVAHSPYQRAADTAIGVFRDAPLTMLSFLYEQTVPEFFAPMLMDWRIAALRRWIDSRPERVIVLVGHGQFFRRATGRAAVQPNLSVLTCDYGVDGFGATEFVPGAEGYDDPVC